MNEAILKTEARCRWACRRGMLELDLFLLPFFDAYFHTFSENEKATFILLLKEADPDLLSWCMGYSTPINKEFIEIVQKIRRFRSQFQLH